MQSYKGLLRSARNDRENLVSCGMLRQSQILKEVTN
jgi:hypothetical protein